MNHCSLASRSPIPWSQTTRGYLVVSFFFTGGADQSIVLADDVSRADMKRQVLNWTGVNGALMANYLINECFGVSVFALLLSAFAMSIRLLGVEVNALWKWILFPLLFVVWAPLLLDFFFGGLLATSFVNIGGAYGAYLSDYLISNIGFVTEAGKWISLKGYLYADVLSPFFGPTLGSLVFALMFICFCWLVALPLYKKKIYIKI